jgi:hypothetical protein
MSGDDFGRNLSEHGYPSFPFVEGKSAFQLILCTLSLSLSLSRCSSKAKSEQVSMDREQGDQIWRIFAIWAICLLPAAFVDY